MTTPLFPAASPADTNLPRLVAATQANAAAVLAAAIIGRAQRAPSIGEALDIMRDIQFSLWADNGNGVYENWKKHFDRTKIY
jgi:hypothetical protein